MILWRSASSEHYHLCRWLVCEWVNKMGFWLKWAGLGLATTATRSASNIIDIEQPFHRNGSCAQEQTLSTGTDMCFDCTTHRIPFLYISVERFLLFVLPEQRPSPVLFWLPPSDFHTWLVCYWLLDRNMKRWLNWRIDFRRWLNASYFVLNVNVLLLNVTTCWVCYIRTKTYLADWNPSASPSWPFFGNSKPVFNVSSWIPQIATSLATLASVRGRDKDGSMD